MEAAHNDTTTIPDWWQPKTPRPQNIFLTSFLSLLLCFTIVMDLVGNSFVIAAVTKNERLRNLEMNPGLQLYRTTPGLDSPGIQ